MSRDAMQLCEAVARDEPGSPAVLSDYLAERGWHDFRLSSDAPEDALRGLLCRGQIPDRALHELACSFAESVLAEYELRAPRDFRLRKAIAAKRRWLERPGEDVELNERRAACARAEARCPVQRYGLAAKAAAGAATYAASTADIRESAWSAANRAAAAIAHARHREGSDEGAWRVAWRDGCRTLLVIVARKLEALGL